MTTNKITNTTLLYPDDISETLTTFIAYSYKEWKDLDGQLIDSIYTLKAICENPFNDESYRTLYDVLSTVAEKLKANNYYK